jgi:hypothetical protein
MAERSSINQIAQVGVETVHGTIVPATRRLSAMMLKPKTGGDVKLYRSKGELAHSVAATGKQFSTIDASGVATYDELVYLFNSALHHVAPTTPSGGTLARQWKWTPARSGGAAFDSYSVEYGDATNAYVVPYATFSDVALNLTRDEVGLTGTAQGGKMVMAHPLTTTGITSAALVPILGDDIRVYMDDTSTALGTTKLDRAFTSNFSVGGRYAGLWTLDADQPSWAALVEGADPKFELKMRMMKNTVSDSLYATLDTNATKFIRISATGGLIETGNPYSMTIDFAGKLSAVPALDDFDNVYGYDFTLAAMYDATWAKYMEVTLVNTTVTL